MPYIRKDIFTGAYVIVSESRGGRPINMTNAVYGKHVAENCPFCPGNEQMTPGGLGDAPEGWHMRWFPNKYPALSETCDQDAPRGDLSGAGFHEIFVDTRNHSEELKDLSLPHLEAALRTLRERYDCFRADADIKYLQIFKNKGAAAGATQKHSHWQLVAGRFVPSVQETVALNLARYKNETGKCLYCSTLEKDLAHGGRTVFENERFAAIMPYASRFTYETWLMPKKHVTDFSGLDSGDFPALAETLHSVVASLEVIKPDIDYNILFMDAPKTNEGNLFHWHVQVLPRMGTLAGYEFSTGGYINHVLPENAAEKLRGFINGGKNE